MSFRCEVQDNSPAAKHKLTGKYNMAMLRELARVEEAATEELVVLYHVETEDDLPIDFNVHELLDMDISERSEALRLKLQSCPSPIEEFIEKYIEKLIELNPKLSS